MPVRLRHQSSAMNPGKASGSAVQELELALGLAWESQSVPELALGPGVGVGPDTGA